MNKLNIIFQYDGMPLKTGIWINSFVAHEKGYIGFVVNEKYNDAAEVEVEWFGDDKNRVASRTSLINIRPFNIHFTDKNNEYKASKLMIEYLHHIGALFTFSISENFYRIENGLVYPLNFK